MEEHVLTKTLFIMQKISSLILFFLLIGCGVNESSTEYQKTIQTKVVAVKVEGNSTVLSSGRLDKWYKIDTRLNEGMIYEVTLEIPRVVKDPVIIPASLIDMNPLDYIQRDHFGRYVNKYRELKSVEEEQIAETTDQN